MKYFLITQDCNYADEFDLEGFFTTGAETEEDALQQALKGFEQEKFDEEGSGYPIECYFGTNEAVEFENAQDYLDTLSIEEITKNEYDVLQKLFGGSFGEVF